MIDLSACSVGVDPSTRSAHRRRRALGDVDRAAQEHGLPRRWASTHHRRRRADARRRLLAG